MKHKGQTCVIMFDLCWLSNQAEGPSWAVSMEKYENKSSVPDITWLNYMREPAWIIYPCNEFQLAEK